MSHDDGSASSSPAWPLPRFTFEVVLDGQAMQFQEVSGLDADQQPIEYRHAGDSRLSTVKMPGIVKVGTLSLKKGVFKSDDSFWQWSKDIRLNTIRRADVTIRLLDEHGVPAMVWTLRKAWPSKITATDMKSDGKEVAVESLEISYEGFSAGAP